MPRAPIELTVIQKAYEFVVWATKHLERFPNFRGKDKLSLSFLYAKKRTCDVVVIGGPNGCGKTAVIEAILLATGHGDLAREVIAWTGGSTFGSRTSRPRHCQNRCRRDVRPRSRFGLVMSARRNVVDRLFIRMLDGN